MSAAEAVLRVLEELRQTALTERLGQVTCVRRHDRFSISEGFSPCRDCGAVV